MTQSKELNNFRKHGELYLFLPLSYYLNVRLKDFVKSNNFFRLLFEFLKEIIYWYGLIIMLWLALIIQKPSLTGYLIYFILLFLINYLTLMTFYEAGYIFNDFISAKKEKNSSVRVPLNYPSKKIYFAIWLRIITSVILIIVTYSLIGNPDDQGLKYIYLIMMALIILALWIHNHIEKSARPITIGILRLLKIIYPVLAIMLMVASRPFFIMTLVYAGGMALISFIETLLKVRNSKAQACFEQNKFLLLAFIFLACSPLIGNYYLVGIPIAYSLVLLLLKKIETKYKKGNRN